jgi:MIP family channel proteins
MASRRVLLAACLAAAALADCPAEADDASLVQVGAGALSRGRQTTAELPEGISVDDVLSKAAKAQELLDKVIERELVMKGAAVNDSATDGAAAEAKATDDGVPALQQSLAEFIAMALFVIVGCGSACGIAKKEGSAWVLQVALTFGLAITVLAYAIGAYSGGQINCAVTFGLVLAGKLSVSQGLCNLAAQLAGSVVGALVLRAVYSDHANDLTGGLGSNGVSESFSKPSALLGEIVGTFLLMFVVLETAVNPMSEANRTVAPLAIGFAVFLAHSVLIPIDGCSINPTRSFGPALIAALTVSGKTDALKELWVFWLGPLLGAALAVPAYSLMAP